MIPMATPWVVHCTCAIHYKYLAVLVGAMHACCMMETVIDVCSVCELSSQAIQKNAITGSGKQVGEDWYERLRYRSSQCCLHDLSKLHTDSSGNSKRRAIPTAS